MADPLSELLTAARRGKWPLSDDAGAWEVLRNWCFQEECRLADKSEAEEWGDETRALQRQFLPHDQFVGRRGELIRERVRARKLLQSRLRWQYGYKAGRRPELVRRDVRRFYAASSGD